MALRTRTCRWRSAHFGRGGTIHRQRSAGGGPTDPLRVAESVRSGAPGRVCREGTLPNAVLRAKASWLRSRRRGVLAGFSASALHGARWIDANKPAYIIDSNRRPARGIVTWADAIDDDEICLIGGMRVTTPVRTAVDLACKFPEDTAVAAIDALARAARLKAADKTGKRRAI